LPKKKEKLDMSQPFLPQVWEPHMVPMADLINHSLTNQDVSKYNFDTTTQFFNVHVKQKYEAGEQV